MSSCSEFAIFSVSKENVTRVIELSLSIINEINSDDKLITSHCIFQKTDNEEEICWHLTWISIEKVKYIKEQWSSLPSAKELESLVGEKIYYGHFLPIT